MADLMIKRIPENITLDDFVEADLLCHYVGVLNNVSWFPKSYIYKLRGKFELFSRLISLRHFEKVKVLFNCITPQDLKDKLNAIKENNKNAQRLSYTGSFDSVLPIYQMINIETIATAR